MENISVNRRSLKISSKKGSSAQGQPAAAPLDRVLEADDLADHRRRHALDVGEIEDDLAAALFLDDLLHLHGQAVDEVGRQDGPLAKAQDGRVADRLHHQPGHEGL